MQLRIAKLFMRQRQRQWPALRSWDLRYVGVGKNSECLCAWRVGEWLEKSQRRNRNDTGCRDASACNGYVDLRACQKRLKRTNKGPVRNKALDVLNSRWKKSLDMKLCTTCAMKRQRAFAPAPISSPMVAETTASFKAQQKYWKSESGNAKERKLV